MTETATFGAGCFWGIEAAFRRIPGVVDAVVGYSGGHTENPTYKDVCTDETGHAEVVQVTFDPATLTYEHLLDAFFQRQRLGVDHKIGVQRYVVREGVARDVVPARRVQTLRITFGADRRRVRRTVPRRRLSRRCKP